MTKSDKQLIADRDYEIVKEQLFLFDKYKFHKSTICRGCRYKRTLKGKSCYIFNNIMVCERRR